MRCFKEKGFSNFRSGHYCHNICGGIGRVPLLIDLLHHQEVSETRGGLSGWPEICVGGVVSLWEGLVGKVERGSIHDRADDFGLRVW